MRHALVSVVRPEPIIDVENVVVILVVISIVMSRLTWLGQDTPGVVRRLISELGVANVIGLNDIRRQLPNGLYVADKTSSLGFI